MTFSNQRSYLKAVSAAFVEIKTTKFTKKVRAALSLPPGRCPRAAETQPSLGWVCPGTHGFRSGGSLAVVTQERDCGCRGAFPGWATGRHCRSLTSFS